MSSLLSNFGVIGILHLAFINTGMFLNLRDTRGHVPGNASDAPQHHAVGCMEHPPCFFAAMSTTILDDAMTADPWTRLKRMENK